MSQRFGSNWYIIGLIIGLTACSKGVGGGSSSNQSASSIMTTIPGLTIGQPEYPSLLSSYSTPPAWQVAGVNYYVGPTYANYQVPADINLPGVIADPTTHVVTVTGNNITLDGYDFSGDGGWQVMIQGAANTKITNSYWQIGSNALAPVTTDTNAINLVINDCLIDGNDLASTPNALVTMNGQGLSISYSWLKNSFGPIIENGYTVSLEYSLVSSTGLGETSSLLVPASQMDDINLIYNTIYEPANTGGGGSSGFVMSGATITAIEIDNNTMIAALGSNQTYFVTVDPGAVNSGTIESNWADISGATGFAAPGSSSGNIFFMNNMNLSGGAAFSNMP